MNKKFLIVSVLGILTVLGAVMFLVSGQTGPGSEVTAIYLFSAEPLNTSNVCMTGAPSQCLDSDTGYAPASNGAIASSVTDMISTLSGGNTYWNPTTFPVTYQCVHSYELCDAVTRELLELVCGSAVGIPNAAAFSAAFPGNFWIDGGEPVALMRVNCATYAANNPGLGLTGVCSAGACI